MKRYGNLFEKIASKDVLYEAHRRAKKGKSWYKEVKEVDSNLDFYINHLHHLLISGNYTTSEYKIKTIKDRNKERVIHVLPYYPDRIVHHAIMIVCGDFWEKSLIRDTFQSLGGRGTSDARKRVQRFIQSNKPKYYLQIDISKYYPSIDNNILKEVICKKIKCKRTLSLLYEIIDSCEGVPIGNYLSQIFGNLYLSDFDWWVKQTLKIKGYYRYCDDLVFLHNDKSYLHSILPIIRDKLLGLGLSIKPNWRISDLHNTGLDFVGYVFYLDRIRLRKSIKRKFVKTKQLKSLASYWGWILPLQNKNIWSNKIRKIINESSSSTPPTYLQACRELLLYIHK